MKGARYNTATSHSKESLITGECAKVQLFKPSIPRVVKQRTAIATNPRFDRDAIERLQIMKVL